VRPNAHSYSAILNACAKAGDADMAEVWLERCEKAGEANDSVIYSSVIDACGKVGDGDRAMRIFRRMESNGVRPHMVAYAALARPFSYKGDWQKVESIAAELRATGTKPNEYFIYAQLLSYAVSKPRQPERAEACFLEAVNEGVKVNDHITTALVRAVGRGRYPAVMSLAGLDGTEAPPQPPKPKHTRRFDRAAKEKEMAHQEIYY
jgi:pentatricopeptide repeat protein